MDTQLAIQFLQDATDTRNESYKQLIADGGELTQKLKLYRAYETHGDMSDRCAAEILDLPEARISARRNKLMQDGYPVISKGIVKDAVTKRNVHVFGVKYE